MCVCMCVRGGGGLRDGRGTDRCRMNIVEFRNVDSFFRPKKKKVLWRKKKAYIHLYTQKYINIYVYM